MKKIVKKHLQIIFFVIFGLLLAAFLALYYFSSEDELLEYGSIEKEEDYIINIHEHIQSTEQLPTLMSAMDAASIWPIGLMGSPIETIVLNGSTTFTKYDKNNEELLKIVNSNPDRFFAFCAVDPRDSDKLTKLKNCIENGGTGLKLYTGHGFYYETFGMRLDDPRISEIYSYCEKNRIPIVWHVNGRKYLEEFENVLQKYPNLVVDCPHFCLLSGKLNELTRLFDTYPNLYTDISFGYIDYTAAGLKRLSNDLMKYREFFKKYKDRIMFGTDEVLTKIIWKNAEYLEARFWCYRDMLEQKIYSCSLVDEFEIEKGRNPLELNGLYLDEEVLNAVYRTTPEKFLGEE